MSLGNFPQNLLRFTLYILLLQLQEPTQSDHKLGWNTNKE